MNARALPSGPRAGLPPPRAGLSLPRAWPHGARGGRLSNPSPSRGCQESTPHALALTTESPARVLWQMPTHGPCRVLGCPDPETSSGQWQFIPEAECIKLGADTTIADHAAAFFAAAAAAIRRYGRPRSTCS